MSLERDEVIKKLLKTPDGRINLSRALKADIDRKRDNKVIRRIFKVIKLQDREMSLFDGVSFYLDEFSNIIESHATVRTIVPTFEIMINETIFFSRTFYNPSRCIDQFLLRVKEEINRIEQTHFFSLLSSISNQKINSFYEIDPSLYLILMNSKKEEIFRNMYPKRYEIPIELISSEYCGEGEIFIIPKDEEIGIMPTRESYCFSNDDPASRNISWIYSEQVGFGLTNPEKIIKFDFKKKKDYGNAKYAFMTGGPENIKRVWNEYWIKNENKLNVDIDAVLSRVMEL